MGDWFYDHLILVTVFGMLFFGAFVWYAVKTDEAAWQAFARDHHCVETGRIAAEMSYGISSSGKGVWLTTPERRIYTCDGGYTVTR